MENNKDPIILQEHSSNNKLFLKDVVYIMSIIILASAILFMAIILPETIKNNSSQAEIDKLKSLIEKNSDYINDLQRLLNLSLTPDDENPLQFSGIKITSDGITETSESLALKDINSDILSVTFYYKNAEETIIEGNISAENIDDFAVKIPLSQDKYIYHLEFSFSLLEESFEGKIEDLYTMENFFILCKITFENHYQHLLYIIGENIIIPDTSASPLPTVSPIPSSEN